MGRLDPRLDCFLQLPPERRVPERFWSLELSAPLVEQRIRVFVRIVEGSRVGAIADIVGLRIRAKLGNLYTADATPTSLEALRACPSVLYVEAARPLTPTQVTREGQPKLEILSGPLVEAGRNVVVGVVDWGCDFTHDDFRTEDGSTRILYLWDQSANPSKGRRAPSGYSAGVEFDSKTLNDALLSADPFATLGVVGTGLRAHGTHVLGIAAGNGRARPEAGVRGMAPEASIIFVQPDTSDTDSTGGFGDSVHLAEAIQYIFHKASALKRPAVVNLSMGTNSGPHDGTTLVEQWIDSLLATPGRAVVLALGNEHHERYNRTHSEGRLGDGEQTTLYWRVLANDYSANEMEIWYSSRDLFEAEIELPDGTTLPVVSPGASRIDSVGDGRVRVYQANTLYSPLNGDNHINIIVAGGAGAAIRPGVWLVHLKARRSRDGEFDAWIERDSMQGAARMSSFLGGSYVRRKTLGSIQSARLAITVSNYDAITTTLADSTSFGPTRDGRRAPTVAAPGVDILSAKSMWQTDTQDPSPYVALTGTSMSAPYVSGVVACMLEKNPSLTAAQIRGILVGTAQPAPGFSDEWRIDWGNGRIDPIEALAATPAYVPPDRAIAVHGLTVLDGSLDGESDAACMATHPHVEGPFYRPGAPNKADLYPVDSKGDVLYFNGSVSDDACHPLADVLIEVWQADDNGRYDNDDPAHPPAPDQYRCRGRLFTDEAGQFSLRTVLPANYKVDPAGDWVRVKHLHFKLYKDGFLPLTTEIALLPDKYTAIDQLFDSALSTELQHIRGERPRELSAAFAFVLSVVTALGYSSTTRIA